MVHFSAAAERDATGVALDLDDRHDLADGESLVPTHAQGDRILIEFLVDIPGIRGEPLSNFVANVRHSHPYGVVANDDFACVVDGSCNLVRKIELAALTSFPTAPNPESVGPPIIENVPACIHRCGDRLIVTILSGFPFIAGRSNAVLVDPDGGAVVTDIPRSRLRDRRDAALPGRRAGRLSRAGVRTGASGRRPGPLAANGMTWLCRRRRPARSW